MQAIDVFFLSTQIWLAAHAVSRLDSSTLKLGVWASVACLVGFIVIKFWSAP